jgi:hypothetical protein
MLGMTAVSFITNRSRNRHIAVAMIFQHMNPHVSIQHKVTNYADIHMEWYWEAVAHLPLCWRLLGSWAEVVT